MDASTPLPAPSLWIGLALEVDTIGIGRKVIAAKVRDMQAANEAQELATIKRAAEDIAEVANSMKVMCDHVAKTIAEHQKRRARL